MIAFSTNEWVILGLVLLLGWLLGLMSRSGGRKWKRAYEEERQAHLAYRQDNEVRIRAGNERITELDRHAPAFSAGTAGAIGAAARGDRDDLTRIRGIDGDLELRLNESGVNSFRDVVRLDHRDEARLEGRLALDPGTITRQAWRDQAAMLAKGHVDEHQSTFG